MINVNYDIWSDNQMSKCGYTNGNIPLWLGDADNRAL